MVLRNLRGHILLTLEKRGDVALQVDDFASDGFSGARPYEGAAERPGKNGGGKNDDGADFHDKTSSDAPASRTNVQAREERASWSSLSIRYVRNQVLFIHFNGRAAREQEVARARGSVGHRTVTRLPSD